MPKAAEWVELAAYARKRGMPARTLRRQLAGLHAQRGDVLRPSNASGKRVGKWFVNLAALQPPASSTQLEQQLGELADRVARLEARAEKTRKETVGLRARLNKVRG